MRTGQVGVGGTTWSDWSAISGAGTTSHTITGLSDNFTYRVELRATDGSGFSTKATGRQATKSGIDADLGFSGGGGGFLPVDEGGSATYRIKLKGCPTGNVTVTPSCTATCDLTFTPTSLTFSTANWSNYQNITVSAARDTDATKDTPTIQYAVSGGGYPAITSTSKVEIKDTGTTTGGAIGPAQPTNERATAGNRQVTLTWTKPPGTITGYEVRYGKSGGPPWGAWTAIPSSGPTTVSHTVTGLDGGSEYNFQVRAVNGTAKGASSQTVTATPTGASTPIVSTPAAPTSLSATAGNAQVTLNWTKPSGDITGYKVLYSKTSTRDSATWDVITGAGATTTTHTVTGLDNGSEYSFKVRAVNSGGDGTATDWVTATPVAPTPAAPTGFSARAGAGQVSLSWTDPSDASITRYELRYGKASERSSATWAAISDSDATTVSHMVSSLENGEEYSFQLRAVNTSGNGAATDWVSATPSATVVLPVLQLSDPATVPEGQAIQLTVTSNSSLTGTLPVNLTLVARSSSSFTAGDIEGTLGPRDFSADFGTSGSTTGTVTIPTTADAVAEGAEAYRITLNAKAGTYTLGSTTTADGTIGEQATPSQPTRGSGASAGAGAVTITWNHPTPGDSSVTWQIRYGPSSNRDNVPSDWDATLPPGWKKEDITPTTASALFELEGMGLLPGTLLAAITPSQFNHAFTEMGFVAGDWIAQSSGPGAVIRHTVRGLDSGVEYSFQVRSINGNGVAGTPSAGWITATPRAGTASNGSAGGGSSTTTPRSNTPVFQLPSDLAPVTEGEAITLELTSSSPLTGTHEVSLTFSDRDGSGFTASDIPGGLGPRLFTADFGSSPSKTGRITIPTSSDSAVEGREHYRIKLNAVTGYSLGSDSTADGTLLDPVPAKPTGLTATPGHGQVTLNWDNPKDASITGWQVQYKEGDSSYGNWMDIPNATATTTSHTVTGLTNGTRYAFRLRAVNAVGAGDASDPVAATPLHPDAARAAKARKAALTGLSRATLSSATDVIGGRISGELNTTPHSGGSIGEQALGIVEDLLGISDTALPSSLSMEGIGEQLWHQTFQLTPPATAEGQRAQADDTTSGQQRNWALWGAGDLRLFNGDDAQESMSYEGNLKTAWVGIDQHFSSPWRAGVAASFSMGESDYTYQRTSGETAGGSIKSRLTAFYPYGAVQLNERLRLWGTAGVGFGGLRHQEATNDTDTQQQEQQGDLRIQLALVGFEQQLSSIGTWDFSLAGDLGLIKTTSQWPDHSGLEDLSITLTRARLGVDSSFPLSDATRGYLNLRGRMDGGELQMGAAEAVAGLQYSSA